MKSFPAQGRHLKNEALEAIVSSQHRVSLSISDNGIGLNGSADEVASESMGIGLMNGLSGELGGNIRICSENGTTVAIQFEA